MSIASRYLKKSLLLNSEIFLGFMGKAQLIELMSKFHGQGTVNCCWEGSFF